MARSAAVLAGVYGNTATLYFHKLREELAFRPEQETPELLCGEIVLDESYSGGEHKGKRGRGAGRKTPVFELLKRNGKVHAFPIPNAPTETLLPIIKQSIKPDSIIYKDSFSAYDVLDVSEFQHEQINHLKTFVDDRNHINGIENF